MNGSPCLVLRVVAGLGVDTSLGLLQRTLSHLVLRRSFPPRSLLTICSLRKENNSFLWTSFLRNPLFKSCFCS